MATKKIVEKTVVKKPPQKKFMKDGGGATIGDLARGRDKKVPIREQVFGELVKNLFNKKKIFFLARLRGSDFPDIIRMIIMADFFGLYYEKCKVIHKIVKIDTHPFYRVDTTEIRPERKSMTAKIETLTEKYLTLTVSEGGGGRDEAKEIAEGARAAIEQNEGMMRFMPPYGGRSNA